MGYLKPALALGFVLAALWLAACSPEDGRRPGESGADVGNRPDASADIDLHGKQDPDFHVPSRGPVAGKTVNKK